MEEKIDVQKIMEEIRADIKEKGYSSDMLSFKDVSAPSQDIVYFNLSELKNAISIIEDAKHITWGQENATKGIKGFLKRIIIRLGGFMVAPIVDGQNVYNYQGAIAFTQLLGFIEEQNKIIEEFEDRLSVLQKQLDKSGE